MVWYWHTAWIQSASVSCVMLSDDWATKNDLIFALMQIKEEQIYMGENVRGTGGEQHTARVLVWRTRTDGLYKCDATAMHTWPVPYKQLRFLSDFHLTDNVHVQTWREKLQRFAPNIHDHHRSKVIGQQLYCASGHRPITHVEQIKWPMADFHLGQHLLFRKHAYTVTCHLAPGALWRPTLPLRDGPPFCSVLKMISMHEISWGAHKLFPLLCIPVWIFPRLVSVKVCERVQTVCAWCQAAFVRLHILVYAHF